MAQEITPMETVSKGLFGFVKLNANEKVYFLMGFIMICLCASTYYFFSEYKREVDRHNITAEDLRQAEKDKGVIREAAYQQKILDEDLRRKERIECDQRVSAIFQKGAARAKKIDKMLK